MVKRIIWSQQAKEDRREILKYWIKNTGSKTYRMKLRDEFNQLISHLSVFPDLGIKIHNYNSRCIIKGDYKIFYEIKEYDSNEEIRILHIWDTRRNPDELMIK